LRQDFCKDPGLKRFGCGLSALENEAVKTLIHDLCLHVAAFNPAAISKQDVEDGLIKEQEGIFRKQMETDEKLQGKPEKVLAGILTGKVNKWLADICMLDQHFVKDDKQTVAQVLQEMKKTCGAEVKIDSFVYMRVGG
jgi:elongation factor Ts